MNFNSSNATLGNSFSWSVSNSAPTERAAFIRKTYAHLAVAILAFIGLEALLINSPLALPLLKLMFGTSWLIVLAAFMGISWLANSWARSDTSQAMQYLGLGLYVVAETIIFLPLLYIADTRFPGAIQSAALVTLGLFAALTAIVFTTRKDFSFLGPILTIAGFVALGVIACSLLFGGFTLGILFSAVMVLFAGGAILYDTSNVLHNYRPNQYVAASLSLFASVGLLFWYVLQIFMSGRK